MEPTSSWRQCQVLSAAETPKMVNFICEFHLSTKSLKKMTPMSENLKNGVALPEMVRI